MEKRQQTGLEQAIDGIVARLGSGDAKARAAAERELGELGPGAVEPMLARLAGMAKERRRMPFFAVAMALLCLLIGFAAQAVSTRIVGRPASFPFGGMFGGLPLCIGALAIWKSNRNHTARALACFEDVRTVGALAEAMDYGDRVTRETAGCALCFLLPRMTANDASLLNEKHRVCLNHILDGKDANLMIAVLKAYEQVGDSRSLPSVRKLAAGQSALFRSGVVQEAACACLPFLEARAEQEKAGRSLLRPSAVGAVQSDALLRPTETAGRSDPHQLLRAGQSEEET